MTQASLVLAETDPSLPLELPGRPDLAALHARLVEEIERGLGSVHAGLFARPVPQSGKLSWQAPGRDARGLAGLEAGQQTALLAAAGSMLADVRRLGESGRAPTVAANWPHLRAVPGPASVFAVDGRPVLVQWAHPPGPGAADLLARFDDGVTAAPPVRSDWRPYAASLAAVAVLALLVGFAMPGMARWLFPPPAQCRADTAQLDLMRRQATAEQRGAALNGMLAGLDEEIGRKRLLCPIPTAAAPPPAAPPVPVTPPPPPPPRADLPKQQWDARDLSMLEGCWHNTTPLQVRRIANGQVINVREWQLCFDRSGNGRQAIHFENGQSCAGPLNATFNGDRLLFTDRDRCQGAANNLLRGRMECTRTSGTEADCVRTDIEGPGANQGGQRGQFKR